MENNDEYLQRIMREAQESQARVRAEAAARAAEAGAFNEKITNLQAAAEQTGARYDKFKNELSKCVDDSAEAFAREMAARGFNDLIVAKMGMPKGTKLPESFRKAVVKASEPEANGYKKKVITGPIKTGKALSEWHKKRMLEHESIKPVQTKA